MVQEKRLTNEEYLAQADALWNAILQIVRSLGEAEQTTISTELLDRASAIIPTSVKDELRNISKNISKVQMPSLTADFIPWENVETELVKEFSPEVIAAAKEANPQGIPRTLEIGIRTPVRPPSQAGKPEWSREKENQLQVVRKYLSSVQVPPGVDTVEQAWLKMFHNEYLPEMERRQQILTGDLTAKLTKQQESDAWFQVVKPIMDKVTELGENLILSSDFKGDTIEEWADLLVSQGEKVQADIPASLEGVYDEVALQERLAATGQLEMYQTRQDIIQKQVDVAAEQLGINIPPYSGLRGILSRNINTAIAPKGGNVEITEDTLSAASQAVGMLSKEELNQAIEQSYWEFMEKGGLPGMRGVLQEAADKQGMTTAEYVTKLTEGVKEGRIPVFGGTVDPYYEAIKRGVNKDLGLLAGGVGTLTSEQPSLAQTRETAAQGMFAAEKGGRPETIEATTEVFRQASVAEQQAGGGEKPTKLSTDKAWGVFNQVTSGFGTSEKQYLSQFFNTFYSQFPGTQPGDFATYLEKQNLEDLLPKLKPARPVTQFLR